MLKPPGNPNPDPTTTKSNGSDEMANAHAPCCNRQQASTTSTHARHIPTTTTNRKTGMENPFDDPDEWLLRFLLEDSERPGPPDPQGPHREQNHHCSAVMATAEATATTGEVDVDVGVADPSTQDSPGAATTGLAESEETSMLWPGSCSMFADVPERSPSHTLRVTPEELRYQETWARNLEMRRTSRGTRSRSRPAPAKVRGAQRTGIHTRKAVRQRGFPEKPLTRQQIATACKDIIEAEIADSSANFKVGLTTDLETRFDYYQREGVTRMVLL